MRKLFILAAALALSACATMQGGFGTVGAEMCKNRQALLASSYLAIANAGLIVDPVARAAVIGSAQAQINALSLCPAPTGVP